MLTEQMKTTPKGDLEMEKTGDSFFHQITRQNNGNTSALPSRVSKFCMFFRSFTR
jgi:hypothetical protein